LIALPFLKFLPTTQIEKIVSLRPKLTLKQRIAIKRKIAALYRGNIDYAHPKVIHKLIYGLNPIHTIYQKIGE